MLHQEREVNFIGDCKKEEERKNLLVEKEGEVRGNQKSERKESVGLGKEGKNEVTVQPVVNINTVNTTNTANTNTTTNQINTTNTPQKNLSS